MMTERAADLYVVAHTEIEWIESLLMMANLAIGNIIANGDQKRSPPSKRSNFCQTHLNNAGDPAIWECRKVEGDELF